MTYAELLADNQRLRKRIIELEQENARLKGQYEPLLPESKSPTLESHKSLTEEEKEIELQRRVNLFRSLFRGREDVYAQRFVTKDGKRGYQPVCRNRWSIECKAHKYKCEGCAHRELVPLDDAIIRRHLHKGAKETDILGLYPIMEDNTCFFLCADFDDKNCQHGYKDDVLSYVSVCKDWMIPVYIERSRSGNGAHVHCAREVDTKRLFRYTLFLKVDTHDIFTSSCFTKVDILQLFSGISFSKVDTPL